MTFTQSPEMPARRSLRSSLSFLFKQKGRAGNCACEVNQGRIDERPNQARTAESVEAVPPGNRGPGLSLPCWPESSCL